LEIVAVGPQHRFGVPDRTPVLFGPSRNLTHVRQNAVRVSAIHAIELFDGVEIGEMPAIDRSDVDRAPDVRDAVQGETQTLVDRERRIDNSDWHNHRVDDRGCQNVEGTAFANVSRNALFQARVRQMDLALEADAAGLDPVTPLVTSAIQLVFHLPLELRYVCK